MAEFVTFKIDDVRFGLRASTIDRVVYAVEITPLPRAPSIALGVINLHGDLIPVVNFRKRLGMEEREIKVSDRFVIARISRRSLAIVADVVDGVFEYAESHVTESSTLLPGIEQVAGIVNCKDEIIFIHDLERFLSLDEATSLDRAISASCEVPDGTDAR